jgi:hypothetical protein
VRSRQPPRAGAASTFKASCWRIYSRGPRIIAVAGNFGDLWGEQHRIETRTKPNHSWVKSGRLTIGGNYSRSPQVTSIKYASATTDQLDAFSLAFGSGLKRLSGSHHWSIDLVGTWVNFVLPGEPTASAPSMWIPDEIFVSSTPHTARKAASILLDADEPPRFDWAITTSIIRRASLC